MPSGLSEQPYQEIIEDWTTNNIDTTTSAGVRWLNSSDTGNTAFTPTAIAGGIVAQAATDTTDDDMCEIAQAVLGWSVQNGKLMMSGRVQLDVVTNVAFTVGFNDDALEDSNTLPAELSGTTWTSNAATFIGLVFDVDATNDDVHAFWVDDDADTSQAIANLRFVGMAPVAAQWLAFSIVLSDAGSGVGVGAEFTVVEESTGKTMQKVFANTIDRDALLTPHIAFENRSGTAHIFSIARGLHIRQGTS